MQRLHTIYDDISYHITDKLKDFPIFVRNALNEECRESSLNMIQKWGHYTDGTKEENETNQALCLLVHITNDMIGFNPKFNGLLEIYDYLDPELTGEIDKAKAIAVIDRVMQ